MPLTLYIKENTAEKEKRAKRRDRTFAAVIAIFGISSVVLATWPYLYWQLVTLPGLTAKIKSTPVPQEHILSASLEQAASNVQVVTDPDGFSYFTTNLKSSSQTQNGGSETRPTEFLLSVPKLKIEKAKVLVDSLNFYDNLALFPGTAIPGDVGNSFITGHSILPEFNDPQNYRAIFTKLSDLEVGDDVIVRVGERTFHYSVQYAKVIDPRDISVLSPISSAGRNLTLMTCVPPGSSSKRLVIITSLI